MNSIFYGMTTKEEKHTIACVVDRPMYDKMYEIALKQGMISMSEYIRQCISRNIEFFEDYEVEYFIAMKEEENKIKREINDRLAIEYARSKLDKADEATNTFGLRVGRVKMKKAA